MNRSWLKDQASNLVWCIVGLVIGFIANPLVTDRALPFVYRSSAKIAVITPGQLGREVALNIRTKSALPGHNLYVIVESNGRYWPQASLEPYSESQITVNLGGTDDGDVGNSFIVHVVDVSGAAETLIADYFVNVGNPSSSVRHSGLDFSKVDNRVDYLVSETLTRRR